MNIGKLVISATKKAVKHGIRVFVKIPAGLVLSMLCFRDGNTHHIVICDHIGDFILTMGYLKAYRKKTGAQKIKVYIPPRMISLLKLYYGQFDCYEVYSVARLDFIFSAQRTFFGMSVFEKFPNIRLVNPANAFTSGFFRYPARFPDLTLIDCVKYGCLELNRNSEFVLPENTHYEPNVQKRLLICPYAVVTDMVPISLFVAAAQHYKSKGYQIYINLSPSEVNIIPEAIPVRMDLAGLFHWVADGGMDIIGVRSGLLDLLAYTESRIAAIYPKDNEYVNFFNLKKLPQLTAKVQQFQYSENTISDIIEYLQ